MVRPHRTEAHKVKRWKERERRRRAQGKAQGRGEGRGQASQRYAVSWLEAHLAHMCEETAEWGSS